MRRFLPSVLRWIKGGLFVLFLLATAVFATYFLLIPSLALVLLNRQWFRTVVDHLVGGYGLFIVSLLEMMYGVRVVVSGDAVRCDVNSLIVMNHRTRLDWMFFWCCLWRYSYHNVAQEKISLEHTPKIIPGLGWGMQFAAYIFLQWNFDHDKVILSSMLKYYSEFGKPYHILLFPEGVNLYQKSLEKSDAYADKHCLPKYKYVLHPRTRGFCFICDQLQEDDRLDVIYDVTVAYEPVIPENELSLLRGEFPQTVYFYVKSYHRCDIPQDEEKLAQLCNNMWRIKEERLRKFYEDKETFGFAFSSTCSTGQKLWMTLAIMFWILFTLSASYTLLYSRAAQFYALLCTIGLIIVSIKR